MRGWSFFQIVGRRVDNLAGDVLIHEEQNGKSESKSGRDENGVHGQLFDLSSSQIQIHIEFELFDWNLIEDKTSQKGEQNDADGQSVGRHNVTNPAS